VSEIISNIINFVRSINPLIGLFIMFFIGLYIFWKEAVRSRKNNSSVFDAFIVSIIVGVFIGRVVYIILNWSDFSSYIWYWLPYERYGDQIYLFRLLPWRFFQFWDGQIDILYTFLGVLLSQTLIVVFRKKWRWSEMFSAMYLSNWVMIALTYLFVGVQGKNDIWIKHGIWILIPFVLFLLLQGILVNMYKDKRKEVVRMILHNIFALVAVAIISYVYFSSSPQIVTIVGIVILLVWYIAGIIMNTIDSKKVNNVTIESVSSVRQVSIPEVTKPIRLPR
jgi:hypothetical protein